MSPLPSAPFLLKKLLTEAVPVAPSIAGATDNPAAHYEVQYSLLNTPFSETNPKPSETPEAKHSTIPLNTFIGKKLTLTWRESCYCITCGRKSSKLFNNGHCYVCFTKLASNDMCAVKPELCHFHKGTCREPEWGEENCFIPHTVYLAISDKLKVGITRERHEKHRWMDQGAYLSRPIARTTNRLHAGQLEVHLKSHFSDKTFWRNMLKKIPSETTLQEEQTERTGQEDIAEILAAVETAQLSLATLKTTHPDLPYHPLPASETKLLHAFHYPLKAPPPNFSSFKFEKTPTFSETLLGIKGQYLIFETGLLNVRKFSGYLVTLSVT